jgi:predicted  nucleic acid-binding Zn-ribbon protein
MDNSSQAMVSDVNDVTEALKAIKLENNSLYQANSRLIKDKSELIASREQAEYIIQALKAKV